MSRAHLHLPITDASGNVYPYASVTFSNPQTGAATTEPIFVQPAGGNPVSLPLFCDPAVIDVWTDNAVRVRITAVVAGNVRVQLEGVDIAPAADLVMQTPGPVRIAGSSGTNSTAVLASLGRQDASFQIADLVGTHEHQGDSAGSVVLTGEDSTDFDPYQTWVGYHAGENSASASAGSSALGPMAELNGTSTVIVGVGEATTQPSTGATADYVTVLSSEDSNATLGTTTIGAANLTRQGQGMTVVGPLNGPSDSFVVPNNAVVLGSGNLVGAAGVVKVGVNHPASTAGPNHTVIGTGNSAQASGLPWAGAQTPVSVGQSVTLSGDTSDNVSADDWFGGVSPLALGVNSTAFNPSLVALQAAVTTQALLVTKGDSVANGAQTYSHTTTPLAFYGGTPTAVRQKISYAGGDVFHQLLQDVLTALANVGLIVSSGVTTLSESGTHPDGTQLEFAETGQALQWRLPATSPTYTATNPFTVASNRVVLAPGAVTGYPSRGIPALYTAGHQDASAGGRFVFNATSTNLVTNPDFETDTSGWSVYDGDTIARDTTRSRYNTASLKITPSGSATGARAAYGFNGVTAGTTYTFSAWVYPSTNRSVHIAMDGYTSGFVFTGAFATRDQVLTPNTWTRISVTGTVPAGTTVNTVMNVGYLSSTNPSSSEFLWVDGAMLTLGSVLLPFVDATGYAPDDYFTGLMARCYNATSVVSGHTIATPTGYLMGRKAVYSMAGNSVTGTLATLSTIPGTGDLMQVQTSGTAVNFLVNGSNVASITDSTYGARVKYGFRITESTSAYGFSVAPS